MSKEDQSNEDLLNHLNDQIKFLNASRDAYDRGHKGEAKRLAAVIRVLVHDTSESTSLLTQLDKKSIPFFDTSFPAVPGNLLSHGGLLITKIWVEGEAEGAECIPICLAPPEPGLDPPIQKVLDEWWNEIILIDQNNKSFTRKDLVLALCNKEGGAHVHPKLYSDYAALTRHGSMGWMYKIGSNEPKPLESIELASVRQIAHEVLISLKASFPEYF